MRDSEIVALLVSGDPQDVRQGLAAAYAAYGDRIHDYARWMLRGTDPAAAADVTQDTFLVALDKAGGLRNPERFRSWLYAIARNECLRVLRVAGRSDPLEYDDGTPHPALVAVESEGSPDMSADLSRSDLRELVRAAAAGLSPKDREVFELGLRHDLQASEIAKALGVSDNAAHALLSRVRTQFERALGALTVARQGRGSCPDLDGLLSGWDGTFGPLWRKRIARHVETCPSCTQVKLRELSPSAILSVVPLLAAPALVRERLLDTDELDLVASARKVGERAGPFDVEGFPGAVPGRRGRTALLVLFGVLLVLGSLGSIGWLLQSDPQDRADPEVLPRAVPASSSSSSPYDVVPAQTFAPTSQPVAPSTVVSTSASTSPATTSGPASSAPGPSSRPPPTSATPTTPVTTSTPTTTTPVPPGGLRVLPTALTLPRGGTGTVRLTATGSEVDWRAVGEGQAVQYVQVSPSAGALADGESASVTLTLSPSTPRAVTELVVVFGPGDHRVTITVG